MKKKAKSLVVVETQREMVTLLGGPRAVAETLLGDERKSPTVRMWLNRNAISVRHRPMIQRLLNAIGYDVTADFLNPPHGNTKTDRGTAMDATDLVFAPGLKEAP